MSGIALLATRMRATKRQEQSSFSMALSELSMCEKPVSKGRLARIEHPQSPNGDFSFLSENNSYMQENIPMNNVWRREKPQPRKREVSRPSRDSSPDSARLLRAVLLNLYHERTRFALCRLSSLTRKQTLAITKTPRIQIPAARIQLAFENNPILEIEGRPRLDCLAVAISGIERIERLLN